MFISFLLKSLVPVSPRVVTCISSREPGKITRKYGKRELLRKSYRIVKISDLAQVLYPLASPLNLEVQENLTALLYHVKCSLVLQIFCQSVAVVH